MSQVTFSDEEKKAAKKILNLQLPNYRKAYSDKTAFLMAALCELSYVVWESRFEGLDNNIADKFQSLVINKLSNSKNQKFLTDFIVSLLKDNDDSKNTLIEDLKAFSLKVDEDISWISDPVTDTQAFIAFNDEYAVLIFRGTEATSIKDIRTDTRARLIASTSNGLVHEGFQEAFNNIEETINQRLMSDVLKDKPLYVAGHSLGGALATIATRDLKPPVKIAACYTFGSPRVGNENWINRIKSPVYRLVNAADSVTMLPPGSISMSGLSFIVGLIPSFGEKLKAWLSKYNGYMHAGNMRYLTNCTPNDYKEVKLLYSVSFLYRIKAVIQHSFFRELVKDHSINVYRKKLLEVSLNRNLEQSTMMERPYSPRGKRKTFMNNIQKFYKKSLDNEHQKSNQNFISIIESSIEKYEVKLRADSELFLLSNLRIMLWEPYVVNEIVNTLEFQKAVDLILKGVKTDEKGEVSSHGIMKSVESNWGSLSTIFIWG